jgi:hypothetical protein
MGGSSCEKETQTEKKRPKTIIVFCKNLHITSNCLVTKLVKKGIQKAIMKLCNINKLFCMVLQPIKKILYTLLLLTL